MEEQPQLDEKHSQQVKRLSNHYAVLTGKKRELEAALTEIKSEIEKASEKLQKEMEAQGLENFKSPRGTFYVNRSTNCSVADSDLAFPYLKKMGAEGLIKQTVNAKSLSSTVKEWAEGGKVILDDLAENGINLYVKETVRIRGLKSN